MRSLHLSVAVAVLLVAGCASDLNQPPVDDGSVALGGAQLKLTLPDGLQLDDVSYQVTGGPAGILRSGDVNVRASSRLSFRVGDLPVGSAPYSMNLTALTVDGVPCSGSKTFSVQSTLLTQLDVELSCVQFAAPDTDDAGDLGVNVSTEVRPVRVCPVLTGISVSPSETQAGSLLELTGHTSSPLPPGSETRWSTGGTASFLNPSALQTQLRCAGHGRETATLVLAVPGCPLSSDDATYHCTDPNADPTRVSLADSEDRWDALVAQLGTTYWFTEENCSAQTNAGTAYVTQVIDTTWSVVRSESVPIGQCVARTDRYAGGALLRSMPAFYAECRFLVASGASPTIQYDAAGILKLCYTGYFGNCGGGFDSCGRGFALRARGFGLAP